MREDMLVGQVREVLADTLGVPAAAVHGGFSSEDTPLWDSLHHFTLVAALEERFGVLYSSEEIPAMISLPAIVAVTMPHLGTRGGG